jgi:hypothetical protein
MDAASSQICQKFKKKKSVPVSSQSFQGRVLGSGFRVQVLAL